MREQFSHISGLISCVRIKADLFQSVFRCSNRSDDSSFKVCDQVILDLLPLFDKWLDISVQLTWATAA